MIVYDIQNLRKTYPKQLHPANRNITLQIEQGEIFGILGGNGAGKSTLVRQMVNLLAIDSGTITLFDRNITDHPNFVQANVGYMPQDTHALNNLTIAEALYFTAHLRGLSKPSARKERDRLLELWQLRDWQHQPSSQLSGGQRRLLRLAVAMAGKPPILILDEPTNDLDPTRRKTVWEILRQVKAQGTTIVLITHDAIEAEKAIDRVGILRSGELVAVGRPADLKRQIDRLLRLEFFSLDPLPLLPLNCDPIAPGHWRVLLEWDQIMPTLDRLKQAQITDFHLYSATLEDLHLHYTAL